MKRFSDRHSLQTLSELNVTPLLDLAFVLLIIFMITTPLMDKSVDVILPSSQSSKSALDSASVQNITTHRDGALSLNGSPADLASLAAELERLRAERPDLAVVIRSH